MQHALRPLWGQESFLLWHLCPLRATKSLIALIYPFFLPNSAKTTRDAKKGLDGHAIRLRSSFSSMTSALASEELPLASQGRVLWGAVHVTTHFGHFLFPAITGRNSSGQENPHGKCGCPLCEASSSPSRPPSLPLPLSLLLSLPQHTTSFLHEWICSKNLLKFHAYIPYYFTSRIAANELYCM